LRRVPCHGGAPQRKTAHDPEKLALHLMRGGHRFAACAKPGMVRLLVRVNASAGEGRSEKIMRQQRPQRLPVDDRSL
jgi:hypothetical protein